MTNIVLTALMHTVFLTNWHDFHTVAGSIQRPGEQQTNQVHQIATLTEQSFVEVEWQGETIKVLARQRDVIPNPPITRVIQRQAPAMINWTNTLPMWWRDNLIVTNFVIDTTHSHGNAK